MSIAVADINNRLFLCELRRAWQVVKRTEWGKAMWRANTEQRARAVAASLVEQDVESG